MAVSVTIVMHQSTIRRLLKSRTGPVARDVMARGQRVQAAARRNINSQSGNLARSITVEFITQRGEVGSEIGSRLHYAMMVHEGTGIYGRSGRPIRPRRSKALIVSGGVGSGFAHSVKGQPGTKFLERALRAAG